MKYLLIVAAFVMVLSGSALAQETGFGDWDAPFESAAAEYDAGGYVSDYDTYRSSCSGSYWGGFSTDTNWGDWYSL